MADVENGLSTPSLLHAHSMHEPEQVILSNMTLAACTCYPDRTTRQVCLRVLDQGCALSR